MKILFHFTITLFVLNLVACNQTKSPEPIKQYTFIGGKEGDKIDTTSFDSLQLSDPFILADEETQMYYLVGSGGSLWKSTNMKKWTGPYQYITVDTTSWIGTAPRIWAPELHKYKGKYYCFVTFTNPKIIVDTVPDRYNVQRRAPISLHPTKQQVLTIPSATRTICRRTGLHSTVLSGKKTECPIWSFVTNGCKP